MDKLCLSMPNLMYRNFNLVGAIHELPYIQIKIVDACLIYFLFLLD